MVKLTLALTLDNSQNATFAGHITASGIIKASGSLTSAVYIGGIGGHITASGDISSSRDVIATNISASGNIIGTNFTPTRNSTGGNFK